MKLTKLLAVTGKSGIFRAVHSRAEGIIVEELDSNRRTFISSREHQVTPLESISIYSDTDTVMLGKVFDMMHSRLEELPLPGAKASAEELRRYFAEILPEHDRDRVRTSDIAKVVKWFDFLHKHNALIPDDLPEESPETAAGEEEEQVVSETAASSDAEATPIASPEAAEEGKSPADKES